MQTSNKIRDAKKNTILPFESISLDQNPFDCSTGNPSKVQWTTLTERERERKKEETTRTEAGGGKKRARRAGGRNVERR